MKQILIEIGVTVSLIIIIILGGYELKKLSDDNKRLKENARMSINPKPNEAVKTQITTAELKSLYPALDSIIKANKINLNKVTDVRTETYKTYWDSLKVPIIRDTIKGKIINSFSYSNNCLSLSGVIDSILHLNKVSYNDSIITVYYSKRDGVKLLFGLRIGKKHYFVKSVSKCNATVEDKEIQIVN